MKAMVAMDNFYAGPRHRISVNPKRGEEDRVPAIPDVAFPPPGGGSLFPGVSQPGSSIFVFYLPAQWTETELYNNFIHMGDISSLKVELKDVPSGTIENKGYGFVTFCCKESAVRAVKGMNGFNTGYKSRLQVTLKKGEESHCQELMAIMEPVPDYAPVGGSKRGFSGTGGPSSKGLKAVPPEANVYVQNLPTPWTEEDLRSNFAKFGSILSLTVVCNEDGLSKGFGFVGYSSAASARDAISSMDGASFQGRTLVVKLKDTGTQQKQT